jgi:hypothetical protein
MSYRLPAGAVVIFEAADHCHLHRPWLIEIEVSNEHRPIALQIEIGARTLLPWYARSIRILHLLASSHRAEPAISCDELQSVLLHLQGVLIDSVVEMVQNGANVNLHDANLSHETVAI